MSAEMDKLSEELWPCLPAPSYAEAAKRLSHRVGRPIPSWEISALIAYVRDNHARLGWNIPHAKRGGGFIFANNKLLRVRVDGAGNMLFDSDTNRDSLEAGTYGSISYTATLSGRLEKFLAQAAARTTSRKYRVWLEGLVEDGEALRKKAARILKMFGT